MCIEFSVVSCIDGFSRLGNRAVYTAAFGNKKSKPFGPMKAGFCPRSRGTREEHSLCFCPFASIIVTQLTVEVEPGVATE